MADTYQFALPLVAAAQAQKHVTVNEALARLDALAELRVVSATVGTPPPSALDGESFIIPTGASGVWAALDGQVAIWANGGWLFASPKAGWKAWCEATASIWRFEGTRWVEHAEVISQGGAATLGVIAEIDHVLSSGSSSNTVAVIPNQSLVIGVTGRVVDDIVAGGATDWSLGVPGSPTRYGNGLGFAKDSFVVGLSGSPVAYYADTPLRLTANGGPFSAGTVRLAVHYLSLVAPRTA